MMKRSLTITKLTKLPLRRKSRDISIPLASQFFNSRFSSSITKDTSKSLKASTFAFPKQTTVTTTTNQQTSDQPTTQPDNHVPQEDIDDFNVTKLIHGTTDLQIAITQRARDKLNSIAEEDKNPNLALKIGVESGGCHGFQYNLNLSDLKQELENDQDNELLVFKRFDDSGHVAQVILDESSLEILQDSKIDYTKELIGSSFKVVDSPYTSTACGCGASFDFDFDKLQKKLDSKKK
jgi:iron-sulfur cluster assembly accessory protein